MSSTDNSQNSTSAGQKLIKGPLHLPSLVSQLSPVEQLPFSDQTPPPIEALPSPFSGQTPPPTGALPSPEHSLSPNVTRPLSTRALFPIVTRQLPELDMSLVVVDAETGVLPITRSTTTSLREPVVIPSTGKKSTGTMRPPKGRRWVVQAAVTALIVLMALGTLMTVLPVGNEGRSGFNLFQSFTNLVHSNSGNPGLIAQQAATVTAVTQDGFDNGHTYAGLPTGPAAPGDHFAYGQCTYWASYRYHQLTGIWVPWLGNAYQWAYGASAFGWNISGTPRLHSIIVLQPYVQGASPYGHVAVVERINSDGSVYTSNWNWYAGGGGWGRLSYWTFKPGPGVSFVWY